MFLRLRNLLTIGLLTVSVFVTTPVISKMNVNRVGNTAEAAMTSDAQVIETADIEDELFGFGKKPTKKELDTRCQEAWKELQKLKTKMQDPNYSPNANDEAAFHYISGYLYGCYQRGWAPKTN